MNEGSRSSTYQSFVCALTISEVEALPAADSAQLIGVGDFDGEDE